MKQSFGYVFWFHLLLIIIALSSPFWLNWKLILLGIVVLHLHWAIFGGCYLTFLETEKNKDITFWYLYLSKVWPNLSMHATKMVVRYLIPAVVLIMAYFIQFSSNTIN